MAMTIKIRIMPSSVEAGLEEIKQIAEEIIAKNQGRGVRFEEEPIAFGLKALIASFVYPEEKEIEHLESEISGIDNVNSAEIVDMRRAIG